MNTKLTKLATMGAAATAIGAVGFFTVPAPAQAAPLAPLPLAPACNSYGFNGATALSQDNGWAVQFNSTGPSATGPATASSDTGTQMHGTLSGGINGRAVDFTINWDNGSRGRYVGQVNEDAGFAAATGTTGDSGWRLLGPLECLTPNNPLPPAPPPLEQQVPKPLPYQVPPPVVVEIPKQFATVVSPVDVYNLPDGKGTVYKKADGSNVFLETGRQLQLVEPCRSDWCHLVVAEVPGEAWVSQTGPDGPFLQVK